VSDFSLKKNYTVGEMAFKTVGGEHSKTRPNVLDARMYLGFVCRKNTREFASRAFQ
jgi:hypothetical protein